MAEHPEVQRAPVITLTRFLCARCKYGASSRIAPEQCPMCGGTAWRFEREPVKTLPGRSW